MSILHQLSPPPQEALQNFHKQKQPRSARPAEAGLFISLHFEKAELAGLRHIAQGAQDSGVPQVHHCPDKEGAKALLEQIIRPDSTILVKASRGMQMEELTAFLMEHTTPAKN